MSVNIDDVIRTREALENDLRAALSLMERSDAIYDIRAAIIENQQKCPHISNKYNWAVINNICPYCGRVLGG